MPRESFERQKLRTYRHILRETGEECVVNLPSEPNNWRKITASITPERRRDVSSESVHLPERIEVFLLRDEGDPDYSGVAGLVFTTKLKRSSAEDPDPAHEFVFRGEFLEQGRHYYRAIFERTKRVITRK